MNLQSTGKSWRWLIAGVVGLSLCPAASAKDAFPLAGAVPGDVFFCDLGHPNPERDFLEQYWGDVFAAFHESGITADIWSLIGAQLDDDAQAEVDRFKEMGLKLMESVEWGELGDKGHACAMRMPQLRMTEYGPMAGGPDVIAILRSTDEGAAKNYAGLVAILDTIVSEITKATETEHIVVKKSTKFGAEVASLYPPEGVPSPHYGLTLAHKGDLILVAMGDSIVDDSLSLLAGKSEVKPLSANPRFKNAFKGLPAPEGGKTFFDMQVLIGGIEDITKKAFAAMESGAHDPRDCYLNTMRSEEIRSLNTKAVQVYKMGDHAKALALVTEAHAVDPTDSMIMYNLCCFEALAGNKDKALDWLGKSVEAGFYAPNKIKQDSDLDTLRDDDRYKTALAKAAAQATEHAASKKGKEGPDDAAIVKLIIGRVLDLMGMMDYVAAVRYTDGYATYEETITVMSDDASQHPLYNAF
ncbi:MAG: hypothetical protein GY778_16380, partial [bacterium]|nr:hypothetical protein [bacterium]